MPTTLTAHATMELPPCPTCGTAMEPDSGPLAYLAADMDGWVALYEQKPVFEGDRWHSPTLFDRRYIGVEFAGLKPGQIRPVHFGPVLTVDVAFTPTAPLEE